MPLASSACRGARTGKLPRSVTLLLLCCAAQCEARPSHDCRCEEGGGAYQCIQGPTQTCLHNHRRLLQLIETIRHRGTEPRHDKRPFKGVAPNPAPVPPLPSSVSAVPAAQTVSEGTPAAALMKDPSQSPNANAIQDLSPTARSPASTPSDKSTAPTAPPGPSPAKPPASTPLPAPAESPSKAPDPNQTSSPALPPAPSTSAAPGPAPAGVLMVAPSPAPAPVPQKCPEGCQKGVGIALGLAIAIGIAICLYWVCWRRAAKSCKSRTSAHLPTHHGNTTGPAVYDKWRKHPQETALMPLHRPPKFRCGDTVLFRDDSAVIRVGDIQEYPMGGKICMIHTQRDNRIHEVAKSEIAPWFEGETGSSGRHRVLFNNGQEESEAEVVKVISRTWPPQYLLSFPRHPTRDTHQTSKEYLWPLHNPAHDGVRQLL